MKTVDSFWNRCCKNIMPACVSCIQLLFFLSVTLVLLAGSDSQKVLVRSDLQCEVSEMKRWWEPTAYWWSFSLEDGRECPMELCRERLRRRRNKMNVPAASKQRTAAVSSPMTRPYHHLNPPLFFFDWLALVGTPARWSVRHMLNICEVSKGCGFQTNCAQNCCLVCQSKWRPQASLITRDYCSPKMAATLLTTAR